MNAAPDSKKQAYEKVLSVSQVPFKTDFNAPSFLQKTSLMELHAESGKKGCSRHAVALGVFIILIENIVYR
jgi:hypothetical protein